MNISTALKEFLSVVERNGGVVPEQLVAALRDKRAPIIDKKPERLTAAMQKEIIKRTAKHALHGS